MQRPIVSSDVRQCVTKAWDEYVDTQNEIVSTAYEGTRSRAAFARLEIASREQGEPWKREIVALSLSELRELISDLKHIEQALVDFGATDWDETVPITSSLDRNTTAVLDALVAEYLAK